MSHYSEVCEIWDDVSHDLQFTHGDPFIRNNIGVFKPDCIDFEQNKIVQVDLDL